MNQAPVVFHVTEACHDGLGRFGQVGKASQAALEGIGYGVAVEGTSQ